MHSIVMASTVVVSHRMVASPSLMSLAKRSHHMRACFERTWATCSVIQAQAAPTMTLDDGLACIVIWLAGFECASCILLRTDPGHTAGDGAGDACKQHQPAAVG